jgi:hypothetical protein
MPTKAVEPEHAVDFLFRVRNGMHLLTDSHQDLLTSELQEPLAMQLGFGDGTKGRETFMRTYYREATIANRVSEAVLARCVRSAEPYRGKLSVRTIRDGMRIVRGELAVAGRSLFEREPAALVEAFLEAQPTCACRRPQAIAIGRALARPGRTAAPWAILRSKGVFDTVVAMRPQRLEVLVRFAHLECRQPTRSTRSAPRSCGPHEVERPATASSGDAPHLTEVVRGCVGS